MKAVIQRVSSARVTVTENTVGEIAAGLLVLVGIAQNDTPSDVQWLAEKTVALRIFPDDSGLMNRSVKDSHGRILAVSQFTLCARTHKGTRPSFNDAARPDVAQPLYELFVRALEGALGQQVATGQFGADMQISLINDGPVTIVLDSKTRE